VEISDATKKNPLFPMSKLFDVMKAAGYAVSDVAVGSSMLDVSDIQTLPPNIIFSLQGTLPTC
jgi:hypothetical protein